MNVPAKESRRPRLAVEPLDLRADFDPTRASIFHKPDTEPAIDAARSTPVFARFFEWSQFPLLRVSPAPEPEGARLVEVFDMRFGTPAVPGFMASAVVAAGNRVVDADFRFARPRQK